MGANGRKTSISGGARKRKSIGGREGMAKDDLLNDQEQEELIIKLRDQDEFLNRMYKVLLCVLSLVSALYFYNLSSLTISERTPAYLSIISTSLAPIFVLLSSQEVIENTGFQAAFLAFFGFSLVPLLLVGLKLVYCMPGLLVLFDLMILRDMYVIKRELGNMEKNKYDLKGA